jgi:hypothetical protein
VLICDGFRTHKTLEVLVFCPENNITLCSLPSHTSHKLQPYNVGPFAPLKTAYRDEVERLNQGGINTISKEHFTSLYKPARDRALSKRNIQARWAGGGLLARRAAGRVGIRRQHSTAVGGGDKDVSYHARKPFRVPCWDVVPATTAFEPPIHITTILKMRLRNHVQ